MNDSTVRRRVSKMNKVGFRHSCPFVIPAEAGIQWQPCIKYVAAGKPGFRIKCGMTGMVTL